MCKSNFGLRAVCDLENKILKLVRKIKKTVSQYRPIQLPDLESNLEAVKKVVINEKLAIFYFFAANVLKTGI
jgi:hypothetical protein